jgi:hypothetical protein
MKIKPSSDQVKALLDSASSATQALGGKAERRASKPPLPAAA